MYEDKLHIHHTVLLVTGLDSLTD